MPSTNVLPATDTVTCGFTGRPVAYTPFVTVMFFAVNTEDLISNATTSITLVASVVPFLVNLPSFNR